jgi:hypothetical protein
MHNIFSLTFLLAFVALAAGKKGTGGVSTQNEPCNCSHEGNWCGDQYALIGMSGECDPDTLYNCNGFEGNYGHAPTSSTSCKPGECVTHYDGKDYCTS